MADRMDAIRARLAAARLTEPMRVRVGYEGARHIPLIDHGTGRHAQVVARTFEEQPWARADLFAAAPADIEFLLGEVERLKAENADLVTLAADYGGPRGLSPDELRAEFAAVQDVDEVLRETSAEAGRGEG